MQKEEKKKKRLCISSHLDKKKEMAQTKYRYTYIVMQVMVMNIEGNVRKRRVHQSRLSNVEMRKG